MRAKWKTVPIGELYEGLYDGPHATPKPSDSGPVFLGIKNVTEDGHLDLSDIRHIAEEDYGTWTRRVEPRPGDIVFTYGQRSIVTQSSPRDSGDVWGGAWR